MALGDAAPSDWLPGPPWPGGRAPESGEAVRVKRGLGHTVPGIYILAVEHDTDLHIVRFHDGFETWYAYADLVPWED